MEKRIFDPVSARADFPVLAGKMHGKPIGYLDSAATTQKPRQVIEAVRSFDDSMYATVRRGAYALGDHATALYEEVRKKTARFLNARDPREIIFTSGATQSLNLAAYTLGRRFIDKGDEVLISQMEHHANIVPWQTVCKERGAILKVIPVTDRGEIDLDEYKRLFTDRTKLVSVTQVSNVLGTVNPVRTLAEIAHAAGAKIVVDGAQSAPHMMIDVQDIDCDFFALSSHKMYGPTGLGVLYGKLDILEELPPYVTGGDMIVTVSMEKSTFARPPARFEAGTPPISQVIGFGAAIDYLESFGFQALERHEHDLLLYGTGLLSSLDGVRVIGTAEDKGAIISFHVECAHPHDVVTILDREGLCLRGGHHCAQPVMDRFGLPATTRASFGLYNVKEEIDHLTDGLKKVIKLFS